MFSWAGNHWPEAVQVHTNNHPETIHICQDLHQADWSKVPAHDLLMASPCCQGHSRARGKTNGDPQHDASRSTAWVRRFGCRIPQARFPSRRECSRVLQVVSLSRMENGDRIARVFRLPARYRCGRSWCSAEQTTTLSCMCAGKSPSRALHGIKGQ